MAVHVSQEQMLRIPLDGGITETAFDEHVSDGSLVTADNVRLGLYSGMPTRAPLVASLHPDTSVADCHGIASCGGSTVALFRPKTRSRKIVGDTVGVQGETAFPLDVPNAGTLFGSGALVAASTAQDGSRTWAAAVVSAGFDAPVVMVTVLEGDAVIVPPTPVVEVAGGVSIWCRLTVHNGVVWVWWQELATSIRGRPLTLLGTGVFAGASHTLPGAYYAADPNSGNQPEVVSLGGTQAYAAYVSDIGAGALNVRIAVFSTSSFSTDYASQFLSDVPGVIYNLDLSVIQYSGVIQAAVIASHASGHRVEWIANVTTPSSISTSFSDRQTGALHGPVACAWHTTSTGELRVFFAHSNVTGSFYFGALVRTIVEERMPWGPLVDSVTLPWQTLQGRGCTWEPSTAEFCAVFPVSAVNNVGDGTNLDPALTLVTPHGSPATAMHPIARLAVDALVTRPLLANAYPQAKVLSASAGRIVVSYAAERYDETPANLRGYQCRFVELARSAVVASCNDSDGLAYLAGSVPLTWDGARVDELMPRTRPHLAHSTGGLTAWSPGTYFVIAVYQWRDARGQVHRSPPSVAYRVVIPSTPVTRPVIRVSASDCGMRGYDYPGIEVRAFATTLADPLTFHEQPWAFVPDATNGGYIAEEPWEPEAGGAPVYSDGSPSDPLAAWYPGALYHVAVVGNRLWAIDAERRDTLIASKEREPGIAHEFSSTLTVTVPRSAGKLVAIVESNGNPVALAERGAWVIQGSGKNNLGQGSAWLPPVLISDVGCTSRVLARSPAGVIFRSDRGRYALLAGSQVSLFDQVFAGDPVGASVFPEDGEAVVWEASGAAVYSYVRQKWSRWSATGIKAVVQVHPSTRALGLDGSGWISCDPKSTGASPQVYATGWIQPAGPHGDALLRRVLVHGRGTAAGLRVTIYTDFSYSGEKSADFSGAELSDLSADGHWTISVTPHRDQVRAFKLVVEETGAVSDPVYRAGGLALTSCVAQYAAVSQLGKSHVLMQGAEK